MIRLSAKPLQKPDAIAERLRNAGTRVTPARLRVLRLLGDTPTPLSHGEVEAALGLPAIDRVTLYRVLDHFVECGLALKSADASRVFRFSLAPGGEHTSHVHFRCECCGGVFCLDAAPPCAPELPPGFELSRIDFDLRGACALCSQNKSAKRKQ